MRRLAVRVAVMPAFLRLRVVPNLWRPHRPGLAPPSLRFRPIVVLASAGNLVVSNAVAATAAPEDGEADFRALYNEGAGGLLSADGRHVALDVEPGEKVCQDFALETTNPGGHGARLRVARHVPRRGWQPGTRSRRAHPRAVAAGRAAVPVRDCQDVRAAAGLDSGERAGIRMLVARGSQTRGRARGT